MQRQVTNLEPVQEKWTKYYVNDIECERDAIYKTIIDNEFYNGKVNISKKYHFKSHEEKIIEEKEVTKRGETTITHTHRNTTTDDHKSDRNANFSLDTKKFTEKFSCNGMEYQTLVEKMIHIVDMFYETQKNYKEYSENFRQAVYNCMAYLLENITDYKAPYNDIFHALGLEYFVFIFDVMAYGLSTGMKKALGKMEGQLELPSLNFDTSSIKENWDEHWPNDKKSHFLKKYLSVMLKQSDIICPLWKEHELFSDKSSRHVIQGKFDEFKKHIKSLQTNKTELDASLNNQPTSSSASLFHHKKHHDKEENANNAANTLNIKPKNQ